MRAWILGCLLGVALAGQPASAKDPTPEKQLREEAIQLMERGRLADARDVHLSLWRLSRRPADAFNVGTLSHRIHDWTTAAEYLTLWLELTPAPGPSAPKEERRKHEQARIDLEQTRRNVGALVVYVSDPGAEVLLDGRRVGTSPLARPVFVNPGPHRLVARLGGAQSEEAQVKAEAGGEQTVRLALPATRPSVSVAPPPGPAPDPARKPQSEPAPEPEAAGSDRPWFGLAAGATLFGAGLLAASMFVDSEASAQRRAIHEDGGEGACRAEAFRDTCDDLGDAETARDALAGAGVASLLVGGAVVAGVLVTRWWGPTTSPRTGIQVRPAVGRAGVGVEAVW